MEEGPDVSPDSREGLIARIATAKAIICDPRADEERKRIWKTNKDDATQRLRALDLPGHLSLRKTWKMDLKHYEAALKRCVKLMEGDEEEGKNFLDVQLQRHGINPESLEGFDFGRMTTLLQTLDEFDQAAKTSRPARRKKQDAAKEEKPKPMGLFKNLTATDQGVTNVATGEVVAPSNEIAPEQLKTKEEVAEKERIMAEAREALGISYKEIDTRERYLKVMRRRAAAVLMYCHVLKESREELAACLKEIEWIDTAYKGQLQQYYYRNKPSGKKTLSCIYGDLAEKAQGESVALPDLPTDMQKFEAWLTSRPDDVKQALGIVPRTVFDRDLDKIKAHWWALPKEERAKIPLRYTPAHESFSIRPSIDTFKKEPDKYVQQFGAAINTGSSDQTA